MAVNPMDYSGKDTVLDVLRTERGKFYEIIDDPKNWHVQTRCAEWEVRDMVGHMIDVTEGYLARWEIARNGQPADAAGLLVIADRLNDHAQALRDLTREEAIARLKSASDTMITIFEKLTPEEWSGFLVTHPYMGPLPTFFYPSFQNIDYTIHTWDMRWGLGDKRAKLDERSAGVLVPYLFIVMQYTVDQEAAKGVDVVIGIKVDGEWGGQWRATVKDGTFAYEPADDLSGTQATFHFDDPSDFALTSYQRFAGGRTSGDPRVIEQIQHLFFRI
jgi:uncharacterized protein (TIGR03083 family)